MKVVVADDDEVMLDRLSRAFSLLDPQYGTYEVCGAAPNGQALINTVDSLPHVDLVITDMRMPVMDGLSALVYLRSKYPFLKIILLTSESEIKGEDGCDVNSADFTKKVGMLDKIAERIRKKETVAGKINSMLEGCEKLGLHADDMSEHYGAQGFVRKPISPKKLDLVLEGFKTPGKFIKIGIVSDK